MENQITAATRSEGFAFVAGRVENIEQAVLASLSGKPLGLTANEIQALNPGISLNNVRSRLTELKLRGLVRAIGKRVNPATDVHVAVWVVVS